MLSRVSERGKGRILYSVCVCQYWHLQCRTHCEGCTPRTDESTSVRGHPCVRMHALYKRSWDANYFRISMGHSAELRWAHLAFVPLPMP